MMSKEPPYDTLVVGQGFRRAYRNGVLVDERTGEPLEATTGSVTRTATCEVCGVTFAPRRPARTCSVRCRKRLSRQRQGGGSVPGSTQKRAREKCVVKE